MKKIVAFGAGIANFALLKEIEQSQNKFELILVDPKDYIEVPFSMLRAFFENKRLGAISRIKIKDALQDVTHIQSKLRTLKKNSAILENGEEITFDYAVLATGAQNRGFSELSVSYEDTLEARSSLWTQRGKEIAEAKSIIIAGGGVIGTELAGEILTAHPNKKLTIITGSERLLSHMGVSVGKKALKVLKTMGDNFQVIYNEKIQYNSDMDSNHINEITTASGTQYQADIIFLTLGNEFHSDYMKEHFSHAIDKKQRIKVNEYLQVNACDNIFAIGDISNNSTTTLGHIAMDQGQHTAQNIINLSQENSTLTPFVLGKKEKLEFITLGKKKGIAQLPFGRFDFLIAIKQNNDFFAPTFLAKGKAR